MRQSIPYSQHPNRWYLHHEDTTTAGRTFNYTRQHQYRNVNGYYGNYQNYYYHHTPQIHHQATSVPSQSTTTSWQAATDGKRKFQETESESSTNTRQKVETELRPKDPKSSSDTGNLRHPGQKALHGPFESSHHAKRPNHGIENTGYASSRTTHDSTSSKYQGSWQALSSSQYYTNENTPPATANRSGNSTANSSQQREDLSCKGCLAGRDVLHLKFFHCVLTKALYSNTVEQTDIMSRQIPGCALVHNGLCFGFEKENGAKLLVVRGTGCLGISAPNRSKCQVCESKQSHVERLMQKVVALAEPPETILPTASIKEIKMVPTLAEAKMRQMECEIQDYKENSITVVNV